jgi:hypothetical protein
VDLVFLPHARRCMEERRITEDEVRAVPEEPDIECPGERGRIVAERTFPGRRLALKVVYNLGLEPHERIVVTAEFGRPTLGRRG